MTVARAGDAGESMRVWRMIAESDSEDVLKVREQAIYKLGALYSREGYAPRTHLERTKLACTSMSMYRRAADLSALLKSVRPLFGVIAKAKTAKIGARFRPIVVWAACRALARTIVPTFGARRVPRRRSAHGD